MWAGTMEALSTGSAPAAEGKSAAWDLLLFSDVHLGTDLKKKDLRQAGGLEALCRRDEVDRELGSLLDHYAQHPGPARRWRLVLAGDIVDFIGINATPADLGETAPFEPSEDEQLYGLAPTADRCAWVMDLVLRRHPHFFERLAAFLLGGNDLVIVRGNHDAALLFGEVQEAFVRGLCRHAERLGAEAGRVAALAARVRFEDWFYLEPGRVYVEHGHLYDEYCADPGAQALAMERPRHLKQPVSALMLRYFANRFPSLDLDDVDQWSAWQFVKWGLVEENPFRIALAFVQTVAMLLLPHWRRSLRRVRQQKIAEAAQQAAREKGLYDDEEEVTDEIEIVTRARQTVGQFTLADGLVEVERFTHGLARLVRRTARVGVHGILRALYLDRAAAMGSGIMLSACCAAMAAPWRTKGLVALVVLLSSILVDRKLAATRQVSIGPKLRQAAEEVARLVDVPLVVMGHSHKAMDTVLGDQKTRYVNLGSWLGARQGAQRSDVGFPHLVLRGRTAEFLRWSRPRTA